MYNLNVIAPYGTNLYSPAYQTPLYHTPPFPGYSGSLTQNQNKSEWSKAIDEFFVQKFPSGKDVSAASILNERVMLYKASLAQLVSLIYERKYLEKKNTAEIDRDICKLRTLQHQLDLFKIYGPDKRRITLEGMISNLEREKRSERVSCWRDIAKLKKEFMEAIGGYRSTARRAELFEVLKND